MASRISCSWTCACPAWADWKRTRRLRQGGSKAAIIAVTASGLAEAEARGARRRRGRVRAEAVPRGRAARDHRRAAGRSLRLRTVRRRAGRPRRSTTPRARSTLSQRLSEPAAGADRAAAGGGHRRPGQAARIARRPGGAALGRSASAEIRALARDFQYDALVSALPGTGEVDASLAGDIAMTQRAVSAPSVLVVDDTIENLRLLSSLLEEHGYEVRAVTNGRQALQAAERDPPDLILLDINMPEMDGYEVCRRLRANERSQGRAGDLPHGVDRHGRQGPGVRRGRRRLHHQAVPVRRGAGAREDARRAQARAGRSWPTATSVCVRWNSCATISCTWSSTTCDRRCRRSSSSLRTAGSGPPPRSATTAGTTCVRRSSRAMSSAG